MSQTGNGVKPLWGAAVHESQSSPPIKEKEEVRGSHVYCHGVLRNPRMQRDSFLKRDWWDSTYWLFCKFFLSCNISVVCGKFGATLEYLLSKVGVTTHCRKLLSANARCCYRSLVSFQHVSSDISKMSYFYFKASVS